MNTLSLLYGLLAMASLFALAGIAVLRVTRWWQPFLAGFAPLAPWLAFAVTLIAALGSLTYSEVAGFPPCELCWYQRILMYPLPIVIGLATWRRDWPALRWYVLPLSLIGVVIAAYHVGVQRTGADSGLCDVGGGCAAIYVEHFGFLTIPTMALIGFGLTAVLSILPQERS